MEVWSCVRRCGAGLRVEEVSERVWSQRQERNGGMAVEEIDEFCTILFLGIGIALVTLGDISAPCS